MIGIEPSSYSIIAVPVLPEPDMNVIRSKRRDRRSLAALPGRRPLG